MYAEWLADGRGVYFPRVVGTGLMEFVAIRSLADLSPGAYGIAEPQGEPADIREIDVFLVPGLGFDRHGVRIGFGGGFYDRALARRREAAAKVPLFVGIGYSCQVLDTDLPADEWDVRLDSVVTEAGVIQIS